MQCPKCGYLGLEDTQRCRNCSYDFSLAATFTPPAFSLEDLDRSIAQAEPPVSFADVDHVLAGVDDAELMPARPSGAPARRDVFDMNSLDALLRQAEADGVAGHVASPADPAPLSDVTFDPPAAVASDLVLDEAWDRRPATAEPVGASAPASAPEETFVWPGAEVPLMPAEAPPVATPQGRDVRDLDLRGLDLDPAMPEPPAAPPFEPMPFVPITFEPVAPEPVMPAALDAAPAAFEAAPVAFEPPSARTPERPPLDLAGLDESDAPLVKLQRPRAPIAVRKTPMSPKLRAVSRVTPQEPAFDFLDTAAAGSGEPPEEVAAPAWATGHLLTTSSPRRLVALAIDAVIFAGIDLAVMYLTLRMAGLGTGEWQVLPLWPLVAFLGGMKLTYATVFTAFGGQTIGKMAAGIRVVALDDQPLTVEAAFRRALASAVAVLTAGVGYVPGLLGERRALHDRAAGSRVIMCPAA